MKKLTLLLSLSIYLTAAKAQQITNGSFENWTVSSPFLLLNGWLDVNSFTNNYPNSGTLRTTDAYDGTYALQLKSDRFDLTGAGWPIIDTTAIAILGPAPTGSNPPNGIPFAFRPEKLTFYYKYQPGTMPTNVVDTARVYVDFKKLGNKVGEGELKIYGSAVSSYTYHEIIINWYTADIPDTMRLDLTSSLSGISFNASPNPCSNRIGNTLYIDKMLFSYSSGINENDLNLAISSYPNPVKDFVHININKEIGEAYQLNIYNELGFPVKTEKFNPQQAGVNVSDLENGVYILELKSNETAARQKLIIQK